MDSTNDQQRSDTLMNRGEFQKGILRFNEDDSDPVILECTDIRERNTTCHSLRLELLFVI
jgi:hypothetical protein